MMTPKVVAVNKKDSKKEKEEKESMEDAMASMQTQMMFIMPLMMGYISYTFPMGLALYLNTLTLVGIFQQYLISGWGGLADWVKKLSPNNA
jgi:YidC/Oxa1 family membrane protein insertase